MDRKQSLVLLAPDSSQRRQVRSILTNLNLALSIQELADLRDCKAFDPKSVDYLVLRLPVFDRALLSHIRRLRQALPRPALISIVDEIHEGLRFDARKIERHTLLGADLEMRDLPSLLRSNHHDGARLHPRTMRSDLLRVYGPNGRMWNGRFVDFAQMGARIQVEDVESGDLGKQVTLEYLSSRTSVAQRIFAQVMWRKQKARQDQFFAGLRFIAVL